ncbi:type III pantothenate kinase [Flammeovirgaceae bacterium SG7u.111]|nr:type III pantothenate kinase [Flammeovirgaceae bacterium SG7u.132]WPO36376.1 type III pantothenate kinase [Flammeovirgaceae bacterium SG7u.111]
MAKKLAIDIGNTFSKAGLFEGEELLEVKERLGKVDLLCFVRDIRPDFVIICNVGGGKLNFFEEIADDFQITYLDYTTHLPIQNDYASPKTLGMDRIAAAVGAYSLYQSQSNLIIDLGTCVTYDFITKQGVYKGGRISPGMRSRFRSMHEFTGTLPMIENAEAELNVGNDTRSCMISGVVNGLRAEIETCITDFKSEFGDFNVILCGGDAKFFESRIKRSIFVNQHLVLHGLNRILETND